MSEIQSLCITDERGRDHGKFVQDGTDCTDVVDRTNMVDRRERIEKVDWIFKAHRAGHIPKIVWIG